MKLTEQLYWSNTRDLSNLKTHLFNEINTSLQIHAKVNELPFNTLLLVFLLLQHKHVVVEELLQLLISEVDAQLLKGVELQVEYVA